ncbi:MAG: amidohydrolase family protein [Planctomycetota bacterium]|nr:amidohydrolase family protein [Planctomycetota bacterium]
MIIDVHSHAWEYPLHFNDGFRDQARVARAGVEVDLTVRYADYRATCPPETRTVVFGGKAKLSGVWVDDRYVAKYVAKHPKQLIGFLSVDPTQEGWYREMREGHEELGLRGIKLLSMYAGFMPNDPMIDPVWRFASRNKLPVLLHTGTTFIAQAPLRCTIPRLLDDVATRFPDVKIILAHLGHPYEGDCIVTIRKHPNVYSDCSALHYRPFQLYHSLSLVQEYGVWDKVLLGSDYPFTTINATLDGLRRLNKMVEGTNLPKLSADRIEQMIYRDTLKVLGLEK